MSCSKCLLVCGELACGQCYKTIKVLREQKINLIVQRQQSLKQDLLSMSQQQQQLASKLLETNKRRLLIAKINSYKQKTKQQKDRIQQKKQKLIDLKTEAKDYIKNLQTANRAKNIQNKQIKGLQQQIKQLKVQKQELSIQIIASIQTKFQCLIRYINYDTIQACNSQSWQHHITKQGLDYISFQSFEDKNMLQIPQQLSISTSVSILDDYCKSKQKLAAHFQRSIKMIQLLAQIHGVTLPYSIIKPIDFKGNFSLKRAIFDQRNENRFNYLILKQHQANTIYLYSRACITVYHPDIEEGRLQQLHEALINRLKGYNLRPISSEMRRSTILPQLSAESLVQHFDRKNHKKQLVNEDSFLTSQYEFFGIVDINIDDIEQQQIQLLI